MNLEIVSARKLPQKARDLLYPSGFPDLPAQALPEHFFVVPSWEMAKATLIAPHFKLSELMMVDCREHRLLLHNFPHYVPTTTALLALALETFRREVDLPVFVSANGGYRSPAHQLSGDDPIHCWATAADIYRVGSTYLSTAETIAKYARVANNLSPILSVKPYEEGDDHLHLDLGFLPSFPTQAHP